MTATVATHINNRITKNSLYVNQMLIHTAFLWLDQEFKLEKSKTACKGVPCVAYSNDAQKPPHKRAEPKPNRSEGNYFVI